MLVCARLGSYMLIWSVVFIKCDKGENMPTVKLSKDAIKFIIQKREDGTKPYTFSDIRKLLIQEFDIEVLEQTVGRNYRKYKDNEEYKVPPIVERNSEDNLKSKSVSEVPKKPKIEVEIEPVKPSKSNRDFDENAGKKFNADDYF